MKDSDNVSLREYFAKEEFHIPDEEELIHRTCQQSARKPENKVEEKQGVYYRYRDNFEREQGFPGLRLFDTLKEAYAYLLKDGKGATLFQCDGIEMARPNIPPPLNWLKQVIEATGVVEIQIDFADKLGKDIWILEKEGKKEEYYHNR